MPGDTRVVKGKKDDAFNYKTTLPGVYKVQSNRNTQFH
ncbi:unnamed protein product [Mesocestoides corti]|uniref:Uncharacterized protein n=1 Tax=Mesocestoides corti TaxID=53468 RepID=A0A3P6I4E5_MESCO|nr:unnamed protein product [Mesocestoides corti]